MKKIIVFLALILSTLQAVGQEMPSVAGVTFGWTYYQCKRILDKKFNGGDDSYQSEKNKIKYYSIKLADEYFDCATFEFQSNGSITYLSSVIFSSKFDLDELDYAKKQRDRLFKLYSKKYDFRWEQTNKDGLKYYVLGHHPKDVGDGLIVIETSKSKNKNGDMKYWTDVIYATINFVNPTDDI